MNGEIQNQIKFQRWKGHQRRIGITGGIASGKSSVEKFLRENTNFPILDADIYSHQALAPGSIASNAVISRYGELVTRTNIQGEKTINRSSLSKLIFDLPEERFWLESLIHPIVIKRLKEELDLAKSKPTVVLIIPLLFEVHLTDLCSEIWVVNCKSDQQCERLMTRDSLSMKEAIKRVEAQFPLIEKTKLADVIIDNSGEAMTWLNQVKNLVER